MRHKIPTEIFIGHSDQYIRGHSNNQTLFEPHDWQSLVSKSHTSGSELGQTVVLAIRQSNQRQMLDLLRRLGIDPSQPDAWKKGFFRLACRHYGVGRVARRLSRPSRNAATWSASDDLRLLELVVKLTAAGKSERQAIKQIASNPKMRRQLPYREKRTESYYLRQNENSKREAALRSRLRHLKRSSNENTILNQALGLAGNTQSLFERSLYVFDFPTALLNGAGEN